MTEQSLRLHQERSGRAAVFIDLENVIHPEREAGDWSGAVTLIRLGIEEVCRRATPVLLVAVCDSDLATHLAVPLASLGVRTFVHSGGPNAADEALVDRLTHDLPESCDLVVVVSGDHFFTYTVHRLRASGHEVLVMARPTRISATLYQAASAYSDMSHFVASSAA